MFTKAITCTQWSNVRRVTAVTLLKMDASEKRRHCKHSFTSFFATCRLCQGLCEYPKERDQSELYDAVYGMLQLDLV